MQHGCRIGTAAKKNRSLGVNTRGHWEAVRCIRLDASNSSMNCWSVLLARRREVEVLVENRGQAPLLQLPQAPDDAAGPVLKERTHAAS